MSLLLPEGWWRRPVPHAGGASGLLHLLAGGCVLCCGWYWVCGLCEAAPWLLSMLVVMHLPPTPQAHKPHQLPQVHHCSHLCSQSRPPSFRMCLCRRWLAWWTATRPAWTLSACCGRCGAWRTTCRGACGALRTGGSAPASGAGPAAGAAAAAVDPGAKGGGVAGLWVGSPCCR
jgi:hypothetical protein